MPRKRANRYLLATEFHFDMLHGLQEGRTVTQYVMEDGAEGLRYDFELRVTSVNGKQLPKITEQMLDKAQQS